MFTSSMTRVARLVFAIVVIGALSFGASQLFAANKTDCPFPPYYGTCASQEECRALCFSIFPENGGAGHCTGQGCCICAER